MPFELVNNLIVIPVEINGKELPFLLDTGVENTILFNFKFRDSITLNNIEEIRLYGLGNGNAISALRSRNNLIRIDDILNIGHTIFVVMEDKFDMSEKMGIDINGIIGGDLFKDLIIEVNYRSRRITFYNPEFYDKKLCKKCEVFPLKFRQQKPYINAEVVLAGGEQIPIHLLLDSGSGDALWLFENEERGITVSGKYYDDYLGQGLSGSIFGKRSRIEKLRLGSFYFNQPTVSFPDAESIQKSMLVQGRNGSIGAEILRRMHVVFDYPHKRLILRKTKRINDPFLYNKSGIELIYAGKTLVTQEKNFITPFVGSSRKGGQAIYSEMVQLVKLAYKPSYKIAFIRPDSPADQVGLIEGDVILQINGKPAYNFNLQEMIAELSGKHKQKVKLLIEREGEQIEFRFELKDLL